MTDRWFIQSHSKNIFYGLIPRWTCVINRVDLWVRLWNLSHSVEGGIGRCSVLKCVWLGENQWELKLAAAWKRPTRKFVTLENQLEMAHKRRLVLRLIWLCSWGRWYMEGCNWKSSSAAEWDTRRSRLGPELRGAKRNLQIRRQTSNSEK